MAPYRRRRSSGSSELDLPRAGVDDMTLLRSSTESGITANLEERLSGRCIYTYIGDVLVAANPFTWLEIYGEGDAARYVRKSRLDVAPHIFAIAEGAFRAMTEEEESQCVIISGESGAGKTEASKQIQNYLALASTGHSAEVERVKRVFLESNPLLEAFGNAKTLRNNNSSRFGKYFELLFDRFGSPRGGVVTNYLLEKSRAVRPGPGERNFHSFYQLVASRSRSATEFPTLATCATVDGVDDAAGFEETMQAMRDVQVAQPRVAVDAVDACLELSLVAFRPLGVGDAEGSAVANPEPLRRACELLGLDAARLQKALGSRKLETMAAGGKTETFDVPLNPTQAAAARDALVKSVYSKLFDWLVSSVNAALEPPEVGEAEDELVSIGVLDIYGFEIFESNGFEQLSINFVNEKLQQIFIALTLKAEQEEYVAEGITWKDIKYFNNRVVCELIEAKKPPGILPILDDICRQMHSRAGRQIDAKFLDTVGALSHPHFTKTKRGFVVKHYAGDVEYAADGFAEANRDDLRADLLDVLVASGTKVAPLYAGDDTAAKQPTAGKKIRDQCGYLVSALMMCEPHYVRCVKSNDEKKPLSIDAKRVAHQVKYLGLPQNIAVRRAGFAYRTEYHRFLERFKVLSAKTYPAEWTGSDKSGAAEIVKSAALLGGDLASLGDKAQTQFGKTKLFVKQPEVYFALERARDAKLAAYATKISRAYRRHASVRALVQMSRDIAQRFARFGKRRRASSVDRPYAGDYVRDAAARKGLADLTSSSERLVFADPLARCLRRKEKQPVFVPRLVAVTTEALYLVAEATDDSRKHRRWQLRRRVPLASLRKLTVSKHADDVVCVSVAGERDVPKANKEALIKSGAWQKNADVKQCPVTRKAFGVTAARRHHCRASGKIYAAEACETRQPFPDAGWHAPERVRDDLVGLHSSEPLEDLVVSSERRSELVAVLLDASRALSLEAADAVVLDASKSPLSAAVPRLEFVGNASGRAALESAPPSVSLNAGAVRLDAPPGVDDRQARDKRKRAEERRARRDRARAEERERRRQRDAARDEQRRQENRRRLLEKKARKAADREQRAKAAGAVVLPRRRTAAKPLVEPASGGSAAKPAAKPSFGGKPTTRPVFGGEGANPRAPAPAFAAPPPKPPPPKAVPVPPELAAAPDYYWQHATTGAQCGPSTLKELKTAFEAGETNLNCLVYAAGAVDEWKKIKQVPVLATYLAAKPPPPSAPPSAPPPRAAPQPPKPPPPTANPNPKPKPKPAAKPTNGAAQPAFGGAGPGVSKELAAKLAKRRASAGD